jgi:flavin reductase (DIM6/NTAB) family NADH-FMN oxidoreductase RutF
MADGSAMTTTFAPGADTARAFRDALGTFATGVTLVTIAGPEGPMGFVANSFSSLSLDPALVLWSIARTSRRYAAFSAAPAFSIHILGQAQADFARRFGREGEGFAGLDWHETHHGGPAVPGAPVRFDCSQHATHDGGDHLIIVGRVLRVSLQEGEEPLVFARGRFGEFAAA